MQKEDITEIFDKQASSYDQQWQKLSAINSALHLLTDAAFSKLPSTANVLCVGAGTGAEIIHLAKKFPGWRFTAIEPSAPMLNVFRKKAQEEGILSRCNFHNGYLDTLPSGDPFDAATAFLVSQFILDPKLRTAFFREIAQRLIPGGLLLSADLAGDLNTKECQQLLEVWFALMSNGGVPEEGIKKMGEAYNEDVAVIPVSEIQDIIAQAGFEPPVNFFQVGLMHAWFAKRA